jgi:NAD(P)-dependent dehydrogenase (short-subunit alcohol dehydrogenase family)
MNNGAKSKTIVITGAGHFPGIGASTAKHLLDLGHTVIVNSRSFDLTWEELSTTNKHKVKLVQGDVTDSAVQTQLIESALAMTSRIDALINNASTGAAQFDDQGNLSESCWKDNFDLNVIAPYNLSMKAKPHLAKTHGTIVNISSRAALHINSGNNLAYAVSKAAMNRMTTGLAKDLAPEISVHVVCPGLVESQRLQKILGSKYYPWVENYKKISPSGQTVSPEGIAHLIERLISSDTQTGQVLSIFDLVDQ